MKGMIDPEGRLHIERRGILKPQVCRFREVATCADDCPFFHEPQKVYIDIGSSMFWYQIRLCEKEVLEFDGPDGFDDQREVAK